MNLEPDKITLRASEIFGSKISPQASAVLIAIVEALNESGKNKPKKEKPKAFQKPSLKELKEYGKEIQLPDSEVEAFYDYQESKAAANGDWLVGRSPMRDWKSALRTWKRNSVKFSPAGKQEARQNSNPVGNF